VTKETTPKPYRLGAFPLIEDSGGPGGAVTWQRSADTCGLAGIVFLASVLVVGGLYLGVGGVLTARLLDDSSGWVMPNRQGWLNLRGLVSDGVSFAKGRAGAAGVRPALAEVLRTGSSAPLAPAKSQLSKRGKKEKSEKKARKRDKQQSSPSPADGAGSGAKAASGGGEDVLRSAQAGGGGRWVKVPASGAAAAVVL
jgi:hypothetical protein